MRRRSHADGQRYHSISVMRFTGLEVRSSPFRGGNAEARCGAARGWAAVHEQAESGQFQVRQIRVAVAIRESVRVIARGDDFLETAQLLFDSPTGPRQCAFDLLLLPVNAG